jgi:hypothetical protein
MPRRTSGLLYDLHLVRRRSWLFIPFFFIGLFVAFVLVTAAGEANAVATMQIETVVRDAVIGGDRGLRIFEAQSMTNDEAFKTKVRQCMSEPDLDYARYSISLNPISVADGVARGVLTVSVQDPQKAKAERLRQCWVDTFTNEFTMQDGLFRTRFVAASTKVASDAADDFNRQYAVVKTLADAKGVAPDLLITVDGDTSLRNQFNVQQARLQSELAEAQGALQAYGAAPATAETAVVVSALLGQPVDAANALGALNGRIRSIQAAIANISSQRAAISDGAFELPLLKALDELRGMYTVKHEAYIRLANTLIAVRSAESTVATSYSFSGGVAGTLQGRLAVTIAFTIVFGLIAIYTLEWLGQVRRNADDDDA